MKKYLLLILIIGVQNFSTLAQNLTYQQVVEASDLTPTQIIDRANRWASTTYNNYQSVFQFKDSTTLVLNGGFNQLSEYGKFTFKNFYNYQLRIEGKDGRYRITADNILQSNEQVPGKFPVARREESLEGIKIAKLTDKQRQKLFESTTKSYDGFDAHFAELFATIKSAIQATPKKDDW